MLRTSFNFVEREKTNFSSYYEDKGRRTRGIFLIICLGVALGVIFLRLFYLQVIKGPYYRYLADSNRIKTVSLHAPRGIIFDRNKQPLVYNIPGFRLVRDSKTVLLEKAEALKLIARGEKNLEVDSLRSYPYKESLAHLLGYVGQISKEEMVLSKYFLYHGDDIVGKNGIEGEYEDRLKGFDGKELFEIDVRGGIVRKLGQTEPLSGQDVVLTIDSDLQQMVFTAAKEIKKGAVIASTPKGEILALVSKPSFDPNLFTLGSGYKAAADSQYFSLESILSDSQNQPLLNRAIAGEYPPGSTFKLVVAASGLQRGIIDEQFTVNDTGILQVGAFSFANWYFTNYGRTDGTVNIVKGIQRSNDIFFYKLAEKVGVDNIFKTAQQFGVGQKLGIDLMGEATGLLPSAEWKEQYLKEDWYLGDTYHYGIGQGYLLTTPLQVSAWTQVIANEGTLYQPHLLKEQKTKTVSSNLLNKKSVSLIRQGMIESCSPGGVAWPLFDFKVKNAKLKIDGKDVLEVPLSSGSADMRQISIACKTGTAEHGVNKQPHAWITLFAPAYNSQIIITVLSEESGEGSNVAAPIAKKILEHWFSR